MRHLKAGRKLGRNASHRLALMRNLARALFTHERIITTVEKAKEARRFVEKLITLGKRNTLHARRLALARLPDPEIIAKLFSEIAPRYTDRAGGYTRIIKRHQRHSAMLGIRLSSSFSKREKSGLARKRCDPRRSELRSRKKLSRRPKKRVRRRLAPPQPAPAKSLLRPRKFASSAIPSPGRSSRAIHRGSRASSLGSPASCKISKICKSKSRATSVCTAIRTPSPMIPWRKGLRIDRDNISMRRFGGTGIAPRRPHS